VQWTLGTSLVDRCWLGAHPLAILGGDNLGSTGWLGEGAALLPPRSVTPDIAVSVAEEFVAAQIPDTAGVPSADPEPDADVPGFGPWSLGVGVDGGLRPG